MADKDYKAFIVEGEARELLIIDNISIGLKLWKACVKRTVNLLEKQACKND